TLVSSSLIRNKIEQNALNDVASLLGREYSILAGTTEGAKRGRIIGYPTANIEVQGLALPKLGVWACHLHHKKRLYPAIANLGVAPTFYSQRPCLLEVHILERSPPLLYGELVEIVFKTYLRSEKKFSSSRELQEQITLDIKNSLISH